MDRGILVRFWVYFAVCVLFITIFGAQILLGKRLIKHENAAPPYQAWAQKHEKGMNILAKILILAVSATMIVLGIIPSIRDFPHIINQSYPVVKGPALTQALTNDARTKSVKIQDIVTGEIVHLQFYYRKQIHKGDILEVSYLPHTKLGSLNSIIKMNPD
ncbi:MAG: hypothetical protein FWD25_09740 [Clostridia bacterium]|nr:hypothetical protein [Clostridia bacterium]